MDCKHLSAGAVRHAIIDQEIKRKRAKYKNSYASWKQREEEARKRREQYQR